MSPARFGAIETGIFYFKVVNSFFVGDFLISCYIKRGILKFLAESEVSEVRFWNDCTAYNQIRKNAAIVVLKIEGRWRLFYEDVKLEKRALPLIAFLNPEEERIVYEIGFARLSPYLSEHNGHTRRRPYLCRRNHYPAPVCMDFEKCLRFVLALVVEAKMSGKSSRSYSWHDKAYGVSFMRRGTSFEFKEKSHCQYWHGVRFSIHPLDIDLVEWFRHEEMWGEWWQTIRFPWFEDNGLAWLRSKKKGYFSLRTLLCQKGYEGFRNVNIMTAFCLRLDLNNRELMFDFLETHYPSLWTAVVNNLKKTERIGAKNGNPSQHLSLVEVGNRRRGSRVFQAFNNKSIPRILKDTAIFQ
ncbi:hypothetical protein HYW53_02330 [Candidatus Giovannonibacteria bacterium]|nr:hypothetical protein [Candidatus Giovannonibacteria bacterium]